MRRLYNKLWKKRENVRDNMKKGKEGFVQDEMINKVVVAEGVSVASNTRGRSKGKKVATKTVLRFVGNYRFEDYKTY
ncbi:hypothetical protein Tco_0731523 [Tanacetum coccineum]